MSSSWQMIPDLSSPATEAGEGGKVIDFYLVVVFCSQRRTWSPLQSRLGLTVAKGGTDSVGSALLSAGRQHVATSLAHVVFLLHGGVLQVLVVGEGKWNTKEQGRGGDNPGTLSTKGKDAPGAAGDGAHAIGDPASSLWGDNVA